jgi:hypothetical protein
MTTAVIRLSAPSFFMALDIRNSTVFSETFFFLGDLAIDFAVLGPAKDFEFPICEVDDMRIIDLGRIDQLASSSAICTDSAYK